MHEVILYTRPGCHLCDDAEKVLRDHGLTPALVNIDDDEALERQFGTIIPVVSIGGTIRFRGRVNEVLLKRILR